MLFSLIGNTFSKPWTFGIYVKFRECNYKQKRWNHNPESPLQALSSSIPNWVWPWLMPRSTSWAHVWELRRNRFSEGWTEVVHFDVLIPFCWMKLTILFVKFREIKGVVNPKQFVFFITNPSVLKMRPTNAKHRWCPSIPGLLSLRW